MPDAGILRAAAAGAQALVEVRPRTTGEVVDDACRLALADAPSLLALSGLFAVPAAVTGLLLLALPLPDAWPLRLVLPAIVAFLLPLTGIGSGACQELFRLRAEGKAVTLGVCLGRALRRGLDHVAARVMVWVLPFLAGIVITLASFMLTVILKPTLATADPSVVTVLLLLGAAIDGMILQAAAAVGGATVHAILVGGDKSWFAAWWESVRENRRQLGKVVAVVCTRPVLVLLAGVNLFLVIHVFLWAAENLLGFDVAILQVVLGGGNWLFLATLLIFAQIVIAPFAEAANYLLHVDARARYEGLDLWYRVRRLFPAGERRAAIVLFISLGVALLAPGAGWADARLDIVKTARQEIGQIAQEIKATNDYRNGTRWVARLTELGARLDRDGSDKPGRFRWFAQALAGFQRQDKEGALQVLADLDRRLALIEESLSPPEEEGSKPRSKADIKALLPPAPADEPKGLRPPPTKRTPPEAKQPVREDDPIDDGRTRRGRQGPGAVGPQPEGGFDLLMWMVIAAVLVASVAAALVLFLRHRPVRRPSATATKPATEALSLQALLDQADRLGGEGLWRQADELARGGKFLDAVRTLYLAVLAMLHRADLIRYAPTRTNGEYVRQLRVKEDVQRPFRGLTGMFEMKWYGERSCEPGDYDSCRRLADQVREGMEAAAPG